MIALLYDACTSFVKVYYTVFNLVIAPLSDSGPVDSLSLFNAATSPFCSFFPVYFCGMPSDIELTLMATFVHHSEDVLENVADMQQDDPQFLSSLHFATSQERSNPDVVHSQPQSAASIMMRDAKSLKDGVSAGEDVA